MRKLYLTLVNLSSDFCNFDLILAFTRHVISQLQQISRQVPCSEAYLHAQAHGCQACFTYELSADQVIITGSIASTIGFYCALEAVDLLNSVKKYRDTQIASSSVYPCIKNIYA